MTPHCCLAHFHGAVRCGVHRYPIRHGRAPKILYTLLEGIDLSGKTVVPFCTSMSSRGGSSATKLEKLTGETTTWLRAARISNGASADDIRAWALSLDLPAKRESQLLYIHLGDVTLTATLADNSSAAAPVDLLRQEDVTLDMQD